MDQIRSRKKFEEESMRRILRLEKELDRYRNRRSRKRRSDSSSREHYKKRSRSKSTESRSRSRDRYSRTRSRDSYSDARSRDHYSRARSRDRQTHTRSRDRYLRIRSRDRHTQTQSRERDSRDTRNYSYSRSRSHSRHSPDRSRERNSVSRVEAQYNQQPRNVDLVNYITTEIPPHSIQEGNKETEGGQIGLSTSEAQPRQLDEAILKAIGRRLDPGNATGPPIEQEIALRWTEIVEKGLPKEEKLELLKKFPTPENCKSINPPKLNPEIKASLPDGAINRDIRMIEKQTKLSVCLTALGRAITSLISNEDVNKVMVIELVSDACRLLSEVQREESLTRKSLVLTNLNTNLRETLNATLIGEMLFGEELEGQIKIARTLERTSKELKNSEKTSKPSKNGTRPSRLGTINKTQTRLDGQKKRSWRPRGNTYQRQNPSTNSKRGRPYYPKRR